MVKVISAYNFQEQNTYSITGDIVATCLIGAARLALAHRNHLIEIITLNSTASENDSIKPNDSYQQQQLKIAFPTIDRVEQMHYSDTGNYILTLEHKYSEHSSENNGSSNSKTKQQQTTFVRIYSNFDIANSPDNCFSIPIRARIASKTTPNQSTIECIEVIEIPIATIPDDADADDEDCSPHLVACCPISGSIAICCNRKIYFYELRKCTANDLNKLEFIDFFQLPFVIKLEFRPMKLALNENVIACINTNTAIAFKIIDLNDSAGTEDGTTSNSIETDSSAQYAGRGVGGAGTTVGTGIGNENHHSNYRRNKTVDFEVARQCNQANGLKFQSDLRSNWDHENERSCRSLFSEDRPILVNDIEITLKCIETNPFQNQPFFSIRSLVQLRLPNQHHKNSSADEARNRNSTQRAIYDEFRCLTLKAIYCKITRTSGEAMDKSPLTHCLRSNYHNSCVAFSLFLTTVSDGYMYQFTNQGKWYTENSKCLVVYPFTAPVLDVIIDDYVIHAVTECGIETFSSRIGHKLFSSYFEYPMMSDPYPVETSPLVDVPICVIGICGFFGIRYVCSSSHSLVLITTVGESIKKHSTPPGQQQQQSKKSMSLRKTHSQPGFLGGLGKTIATTNTSNLAQNREWTIYDLRLPKPEMIIDDIENLASIFQQTSPQIYFELMEEAHIIIRLAQVLLNVSFGASTANQSTLAECYRKICRILADFAIRSPRKEIYSQAVAYYTMCKHSTPDLYINYMNSKLNLSNYDGLIYTLKMLISRIGSNKSDGEYLTQNLSRQQNTNSDVQLLDRSCAEEFFEFFLRHSSIDLAQIALSCSVFRENLNQRFLMLYDDGQRKLSIEEKFTKILCLCYRAEYTKALGLFETFERSQIYRLLRDYWSRLLFENYQAENYRKCSFSDLTESILFVTKCDRLIEATADIFIRILVVTRDIDLDCILKLFMNYFALHIGQPGYKQSQRIFEIILQAYFYDCYNYGNCNAISSCIQAEFETNARKLCLESNDNWTDLLLLSPGQAMTTELGRSSDQIRQKRIDKRQNSVQQSDDSTTSTTIDSNYDIPELEALKILFRMYLGLLKQHSSTTQSVDDENSDILINYRLAFINYMHHNFNVCKSVHTKYDSNNLTNSSLHLMPILPDYENIGTDDQLNESNYWHCTAFRRPIVFFERREMWLNQMPPFDRVGCFKYDFDGSLYFDDWSNDVNLIVLKIQSLLSSGKLDSTMLNDFIEFVHSNPNVIGIDSMLTILFPKSEAFEFLIHACPKYLLDYAKVRLTTSGQWQILFQRILVKKREFQLDDLKVKMYNNIINDILRYLIEAKSLDLFLDCIPEQHLSQFDTIINDKTNDLNHKTQLRTQDGVDENNPFELIMREALIKQRCDALSAMIQSSGRHLNDAVNNCQLNFN